MSIFYKLCQLCSDRVDVNEISDIFWILLNMTYFLCSRDIQ